MPAKPRGKPASSGGGSSEDVPKITLPSTEENWKEPLPDNHGEHIVYLQLYNVVM